LRELDQSWHFPGEPRNLKIAALPFPRGKYMGTPREPLTEASRFRQCQLCGGYIDILDLAWVNSSMPT
jgi:hypothetical protein